MTWKRFSSRLGLVVGFAVYFIFRNSAREFLHEWAPVALLCCVYALFWLMGCVADTVQKRVRSKSEAPAPKPCDRLISESRWNAWTVTKMAVAVSVYAVSAGAFAYWRASVPDGLAVFLLGIADFVTSGNWRNGSTPIQFSLRMLFLWTTIFAICFGVVTYLTSNLPNELRVFISLFGVCVAVFLIRLTWEYHRRMVEIENWPLDGK